MTRLQTWLAPMGCKALFVFRGGCTHGCDFKYRKAVTTLTVRPSATPLRYAASPAPRLRVYDTTCSDRQRTVT